MCGIVGFLGIPENVYDIKNIKYLLHMNMNRGKDSTGIWDITNGLQKKTITSEDFIIDDDIKWTNSNLLLGHCRSASSGAAKCVEGAHPHEYDNLVGVHNGTLKFCYELAKNYNEGKYGNNNIKIEDYYKYTDSQLLYKIINNTKSTKVLSHIEGSAALLFYDKNKPNVLYAYRKHNSGNDERPLYYGFSSDEKHSGIYFSSIEKSLKIINCKNIKEVESEHIVIFENGKLKDKVKINIKPHTNSYNNSRTNNYKFDNQIFINRWFIANDKKWYKHTGETTINNYYTQVITYKCIDDQSNICWLYESDFPDFPEVFKSYGSCVFMTDIVDSNDEDKYLFIKGQVSKIISINYENKELIINSYNGQKKIKFEWVRPTLESESMLIHIDSKFKNFTENDMINFIKNKNKNKNKNVDNNLQNNDNISNSKLINFLINNNVFLNDIAYDYSIIKEIDDNINNDKESLDYIIDKLYCLVNDKFDKNNVNKIIVELITRIKIFNLV